MGFLQHTPNGHKDFAEASEHTLNFFGQPLAHFGFLLLLLLKLKQ